MLGIHYEEDALVAVGMLVSHADTDRRQTRDYPKHVQELLRELEDYAIANENGDMYVYKSERSNVSGYMETSGGVGIYVEPANIFGKYLVHKLIREMYVLHRLLPIFKDDSLNKEINEARARHPKSFWQNLFG